MNKVLIVPLCSVGVLPQEVDRCIKSIKFQDEINFDWDIKVVCNTNSDEYYQLIKKVVGGSYETIKTPSNGGNGMGHNSVLELFKKVRDTEAFTHLIMIDADDYYYPCAFQAYDDLLRLVPDVDYLSNMQFADSVRRYRGHYPGNQPRMEIAQDIWLHSNFNYRFPITPYVYWDGVNCHGGEVTLLLSANAVECDLKHLETPGIPDDYTHMLWALKAYVEGRIKFVNTDCNDIYIYDKTNPVGTTNQPTFKFNPRDWPAKDRELVCGETFECLRNFTRFNIPWVTIPQIFFPEEKARFILNNLLHFS